MSTADLRRATCCGFYGVPRAFGLVGRRAPPYKRFGGQPSQNSAQFPCRPGWRRAVLPAGPVTQPRGHACKGASYVARAS